MAYQVYIRHARQAIDLVLHGAVKKLSSEFTDHESPEYKQALKDLFENCEEEVQSWLIVD